jgi:Concanavalin A-like lectin/glucanases superfamily
MNNSDQNSLFHRSAVIRCWAFDVECRMFAVFILLLLLAGNGTARADTVALWLFDEPAGLYPSSILNDASGHALFLAFGRGARIVEGHFGRALEPAEPALLKLSTVSLNPEFGLLPPAKPAGRKTEPMAWMNAHFCALMTKGETTLRKPPFVNVTDTRLNLGAFDWTVEFWFCPTQLSKTDGVVFEIGEGPRGENDHLTRLTLNADRSGFVLENQPSDTKLAVPSSKAALSGGWHHLAFVYAANEQQLRHYVDGALQPLPARAALKALPHGEEAYFSIGRDGLWNHPLPGRLDELRFSDDRVYTANFQTPGSFSVTYGKGLPKVALKTGPPLLFEANADRSRPVELGSRKYVFTDDALVAEMQGITFTPQPPKQAEMVLDHVRGHLSLVEDEQGLLRLYYRETGDYLAVMTSRDGVHWEKPDLGRGEFHGMRNVVVRYPVALGNVFMDPNAPPESRWKYFSGIRKQAMFIFTSPDGWEFKPFETAALPFSAGSQSVIYYDDQRQLYVGHHRSDYARMPGGKTQRRFVRSETKDVLGLWP